MTEIIATDYWITNKKKKSQIITFYRTWLLLNMLQNMLLNMFGQRAKWQIFTKYVTEKKKKSITCCILKSQMGKSQIYVYEIMKVSFKPLQLEHITFNYNSKLNRKTPLMPRNISVLCLAISF